MNEDEPKNAGGVPRSAKRSGVTRTKRRSLQTRVIRHTTNVIPSPRLRYDGVKAFTLKVVTGPWLFQLLRR